MDAMQRVRLRIVPSEDVHPHEIADPGREVRIEERLQQEGVLRDPVVVGAVHDVEGYVLLDGTNRQRALANLGYPWLMVQIVDYGDDHAVHLRTWCHAVQMPMSDILRQVEGLTGAEVVSLPPLSMVDALANSATVAVLADNHMQVALTRPLDSRDSRADILRRTVDIYEDKMVRVDCEPDDVESRAQSIGTHSTLVAYPRLTRSGVVTMAMRGMAIPAGITRHVILCGRALRINLPLDILSDALDVDGANEALQAHLATLGPRLYREPTILYDS